MIKRLTSVLVVICVCATAHASTVEKNPVSLLAWEIGFERFGDVLLRYVKFDAFSEYPCLRFETLTDSHKLIDRMEVCKLPLSNETVDVRKLNSVMFEHFKATENTFHFSANLDFSTPGHGAPNNYYHCKVDVSSKGKLAGPVCKQIDRQTYKQEEQDEKKDQKNKDQQ